MILKKTDVNKYAKWSFVIGIMGLVFSFIPLAGIPFGLCALYLSYKAKILGSTKWFYGTFFGILACLSLLIYLPAYILFGDMAIIFMLTFMPILFIVIGCVGYLKIRGERPQRIEEVTPLEEPVQQLPTPENERYVIAKKTVIENSISELQKNVPNIFVDDIKALTSQNKFDDANKLFAERKNDYNRFLQLQKNLKNAEEESRMLSKRLAKGELPPDAYERAKDDLDREKHDIEEELWQVQRKIFREKYEKPF